MAKRERVFAAVGARFGLLTVVGAGFVDRRRETWHECRCDCGNTKAVRLRCLTLGLTQSCGCLQRKRTGDAKRRHGESTTRLYRLWLTMIQRCTNRGLPCWEDYGGRGIRVCDEWRGSYEAFRDWALANGYRQGLTIDRRNNGGDYGPANCRFVSRRVNNRNRRSNHLLTAFGETKCLAEWAEDPRCLVNADVVRGRVTRYGWGAEKALSTPIVRGYQERKV